jgi:alpha-mannosidase
MNTPRVELEVLLLDREKKIEFRYRVQKEYTTRKEGVYIAFPVAVEHPEYVYATQQQWVNPARNLMKGGSLEWFNIQYWMAVEDTGMVAAVVPIDTPLASFGDINRGTWPGTFNPKTATLFSYVMNNYWHTNYRAGQGGDFTFRYALTTSAKLDSGALTKFGMEEMRPAEINNVVSQDKVGDPVRPLPETGAEFMRIGGDGVALITWKEAANGKGTILRLQEIAGRAQDATVRFPRWALKSAQLCSGVEDDLRDIPVEGEAIRVRLKPFEVLTVRVSGAERQTVLP